MSNNPVFIRADENMQISSLCLVLMEEKLEDGQVGLLNRVPVLLPKSRTILTPAVLHLPIHFFPKNRALKKEVHIVPEVQLSTKEATSLISFVSKIPQVLRSMEEKIHNLQKRQEISSDIVEMFTSFKTKLSYDVVSHFSVSTQADKLYLIEQHGDVISHVGKFKPSNRGGYFNFTTYVAAIYESVAQTLEVNCKMYIFLDQDKLGYYFEFFLNQQNFLHRKIYEQLPDLLMEHHPFLERALSVLETSSAEQPNVVEIIEKFREAL